ncbi:nitric oxide reductase, NorZ apoprotein [Saccharicrinis carchari]|uniref:Nitric oxide reductase, NorZ apoprotein n=1 Tax=Saccharicrinis carchari TaxID=1168039 RepID=A0A521E071_SACCC|nr:nitric-oxide reductase large subunit [Saccharicrinis carchari]SMO77282.1 nitric oxide reductase, NorZ apoprotein [Saccharicrinis carchari]
MNTKKLWIAFTMVMVISFGILGYYGYEIYKEAPPIPKKVVTADGTVIFTASDIKDGQNVWQSIGGQEVGSVWGHGAYKAPDWTADWLHREAVFILDKLGEAEYAERYDKLDDEKQALLQKRLQNELRTNSYDFETGILHISALRLEAFKAISRHYANLFMDGEQEADLREAYAIPANSIKDADRMFKFNCFLFWATWSTVTERPGQEISYTNNWPPEKLVANEPSGSLLLWTGFSVIILIAGIGMLAWYYASHRDEEENSEVPAVNPLSGVKQTPSMKATLKYFWVVTALILVQILMGVVTAHYGVEGLAFYGFPLADFLPYSITRTWHIQLAIFWIATSWLATGLFIAPAVSGKEPKFQKLGVDILFGALLVIVLGSLAGQWFGVMQKLGLAENFWFGHQGYEYVDLGRFWQIFLFLGLFIWLFLMGRAIWPALQKRDENQHLLWMFLIASIAIAAFYGAGLMWGQQTHLTIASYWRWWVVHLWVEGFFEVFATVVIAFLFVRMQLLRPSIATASVLFSTVIFLSGGILGTFHHLYFAGTPTAVLAIGASFSALEVAPLVFMGFEAYHNIKISKATAWVAAYKWPIYFFVSVAFWNLLGAGVFGFLINPPIALYYMQGLNTTPVHAHTALFGVYGMLGIGLMLFVLRDMDLEAEWKEKPIKYAFWGLNIGLLLMVLLSVLPVGLAQTVASVKHGLWYARSAEFLETPFLETIRWMRVIGDTIFAVGALYLVWFVFGLKGGWSVKK